MKKIANKKILILSFFLLLNGIYVFSQNETNGNYTLQGAKDNLTTNITYEYTINDDYLPGCANGYTVEWELEYGIFIDEPSAYNSDSYSSLTKFHNSCAKVKVQWDNSHFGFVLAILKDDIGDIYDMSLDVSIDYQDAPPIPIATVIQATCPSLKGSISVTTPVGPNLEYSVDGINYQESPIFLNLPPLQYSLKVRDVTNNGVSEDLFDIYPINTPLSPIGEDKFFDSGELIPNLVATVNSGEAVDWYSTSVNGNLLLSNSTSFFTVSPGTYYAEARDVYTGCISTSRTSITLTQNYLSYIDANSVIELRPSIETTDAESLTSIYDVVKKITYFDGLGRPIQIINVQQNPNEKDIVKHIVYDSFGRQVKDWLPYIPTDNYGSSNNPGSYRGNNLEADIKDFYLSNYGSDLNEVINPYSEKNFEPSPLNRVLEQAAPGTDWALDKLADTDHTIKFGYSTNLLDEVRLFETVLDATYVPSLTENGYYPPNELYKSIVKDENWIATDVLNHTTEEFKDKQGRVILKRTYTDTDGDRDGTDELQVAHDTYYVYDAFGNLTYVLSPNASAQVTISIDILNDLCYQYVYDTRNRLVEKKIPGKEREYIIYDSLDRPILTQDGKLRADNQWLFTKYDVFSRIVYTGIISVDALINNRVLIQSDVDNPNGNFELNESRTVNLTTLVDTSSRSKGIEYTYIPFPFLNSALIELLSINYYDSYVDLGLGNLAQDPGSFFGQTTATNVKGLATNTEIKVLGTSKWIQSVIYYDSKARPIYTYSKNQYLNTKDIVKIQLDFTGNVLKTITKHFKGTNPEIKTEDIYTYNHANRLLEQKQKINNATNYEVIAQNTYDELGQLIQKGVGHIENTNGKRLQTIDYEYNIRGWLKTINKPESNLTDDLFAFGIGYNTYLKYNSGNSKLGSKALYNGNINETYWRSANDDKIRGSSYKYDALNRIISSRYKAGKYFNKEVGFFDLKNVKYDHNGNIGRLVRNGPNATFDAAVIIDQLDYRYDKNGNSNMLIKVTEAADLDIGFIDIDPDYRANGIKKKAYNYDVNGNLKKDNNKGIKTISYNHLNLPITVNFGGGNKINYIYDATGIKLTKEVKEKNKDSIVTTYAGNYVYENGTLQFFGTDEGYVTPDGSGGFDYVYQFLDHLGNIRLSYSDANNNGSIEVTSDPLTTEIIEENSYYPFGGSHKGYNNVINGTHHPYGFGGKEENDELGLQWLDFGARNYDKWLGRWMNIDPLADKMRNNSPYNYAFNNPILFVDPDGMFPIIIHVRSFAPYKYFGAGLWHGDNRSFSRDPSASSRLSQYTHYETDTRTSSTRAFGGFSSSRYGAFAYSEANLKDYSSGNNVNTHMYGNNDAVFLAPNGIGLPPDGGPTWAIDVHTNLNVEVSDIDGGNQLLTISGKVSGDTFPNGEAFVSDAEGNSVWLGTFASQAGPNKGPFWTLKGDKNAPMININIGIVTDKNGIFTGVQVGGKTISLDQWNKDTSGAMSVEQFKKKHRDLYDNLFGSTND